jgi:hypothetical protein
MLASESSTVYHLVSKLSDKEKFKVVLKRYLNTHIFCSVDEFLGLKRTHNPFRGYCTYIV